MSIIPKTTFMSRVYIFCISLASISFILGSLWYTYKAVILFPAPNYMGVCFIALVLLMIGLYFFYHLIRDVDSLLEEAHAKGVFLGCVQFPSEVEDIINESQEEGKEV